MDPHESSRSNSHNMVLLVYFAYTTLSTVGFGDFNPRSDYERLFCIVIFLFGVAIFGLILGNFQEILIRFNSLDDEYEEEDRLCMFFDTLKKYNRGFEIDADFVSQTEKYFQHRWASDRNQAIYQDNYQDLLIQLPDETVSVPESPWVAQVGL